MKTTLDFTDHFRVQQLQNVLIQLAKGETSESLARNVLLQHLKVWTALPRPVLIPTEMRPVLELLGVLAPLTAVAASACPSTSTTTAATLLTVGPTNLMTDPKPTVSTQSDVALDRLRRMLHSFDQARNTQRDRAGETPIVEPSKF